MITVLEKKAREIMPDLKVTTYPDLLCTGVEENVAQAFWGSTVTVDVWLVEHHNPYSTIDTFDYNFIKM